MKRRCRKLRGEILEARRCLAPVAFVPESLVDESVASGVHQTIPADIDNDGDVDLVSIGSGYILTRNPQTFRLVVSENRDGHGNFASRTIDEADVSYTYLAVFDFDGDGDVDIVASRGDRFIGDQTHAFENDGRGVFGEPKLVGEFAMLGTADTDADGDLDLLGRNIRSGVVYRSDNAGGFGQPASFSGITRDTTQVIAGDVDGDQDDDILIVEGDGVSWRENHGGTFGHRSIELLDSRRGAPSATFSDVDNDGDLDVIAAYNPVRRLVWYEFANGSYGSAKSIATFDSLPRSGPIQMLDVDDDGDNDIVLPVGRTQLAWLEYNAALGEFVERGELIRGKQDYDSIEVADINGDQVDDIVIASRSSDVVAWYEKSDDLTFQEEHRVLHSQSRPHALRLADVDADGDLDLFAAALGDFLLWKNDDGNFGVPKSLKLDVALGYDIETADIDGDGWLDVVSADFAGQVHWIRHTDGQGEFGPSRLVTDQHDGIEAIALGDADGDADIDIFVASRFDGTVAWYENNGQGEFGTRQLIAGSAGHIRDVALGDLDGDGDLDVLSGGLPAPAFPGAPIIAWYENQSGQGDFGSAQPLTEFRQPGTILTHDLDGDGDEDVIAASTGLGSIYLYENTSDGLQSRGLAAEVGSEDIDVADVDGDGDSDIVTVGRNHVAWVENLGEFQFKLRTPITDKVYDANAIAAGDVDRDGRVDLIFASNASSEILQRRNAGTPGDANGDGMFDDRDLVQVFEANEFEDDIANNSTVSDGDFNGDGEFTTADLVFAMAQGEYTP